MAESTVVSIPKPIFSARISVGFSSFKLTQSHLKIFTHANKKYSGQRKIISLNSLLKWCKLHFIGSKKYYNKSNTAKNNTYKNKKSVMKLPTSKDL